MADFIKNMPKLELHLHLEGAFTLDFLLKQIRKYGGAPEIRSIKDLQDKFIFRDFSHFIDTWVWKNQFFRTAEDFEQSTYFTLEDLARQNVIYTEVYYSPWDFVKHGLSVSEITGATIAGIDQARRDVGIECRLIADLIREGEEVQIIDHASGDDLTTLTLTQIILEEQKKHSGLLSHSTLTSLIRAGEDRLSALQRSLQSSLNFWYQIDEEIKQRIQSLVRQGELTAAEGENLISKMRKQGLRRREERQDTDALVLASISTEELEVHLQQRQIPTQQDLKRLYDQLEELAVKLEQVKDADTGSG